MEAVTAFKTVILVTMIFASVLWALNGLGSAIVTIILGYGLAFSVGMFMNRNEVYDQVAKTSDGAKYGLTNFYQCKNPSPFDSKPDAYCLQMVKDLALKQHDEAYAKQAIEAIASNELKQKEVTLLSVFR